MRQLNSIHKNGIIKFKVFFKFNVVSFSILNHHFIQVFPWIFGRWWTISQNNIMYCSENKKFIVLLRFCGVCEGDCHFETMEQSGKVWFTNGLTYRFSQICFFQFVLGLQPISVLSPFENMHSVNRS